MEATRAWITPENLKPFSSNRNIIKYLVKYKKSSHRLKAAMAQADEADSLALEKRLEKFSFISRHKGNINSPKKVNLNDLKKYQRYLKKKFNIEFPITNSDSENEMPEDNENLIMLGTPKRARKETKDKGTTKRRLINVLDKENDLTTNVEKESSNANVINTDNPSNSMVAQVGSTEATIFDNDTSTTYAPNNCSEGHGLSDRAKTPNSDDFEF